MHINMHQQSGNDSSLVVGSTKKEKWIVAETDSHIATKNARGVNFSDMIAFLRHAMLVKHILVRLPVSNMQSIN